jgi:hypothetical protein
VKTYTVKTGRQDKWWWIEIPGIDMGFSQAKTYRQVESMAREVISMLEGVPENSFDVTIQVEGPEAALIKTVEMLDADAQEAQREAARVKRQVIKALQAKHIPVRDIAELLHVSAGYVSQLGKDTAA